MNDVHTRHCCIIHGCKYGDETCTVVTKKETQEGICEDCYETLSEGSRESLLRSISEWVRCSELRKQLREGDAAGIRRDLLSQRSQVERFIRETHPEDVIDLASWEARLNEINKELKELES